MFGTNVTLITKDWDYKGVIKCTAVPHKGEFIYLSDFQKYVVVINIVHQTGFWGTKVVAIVEDVTTNIPIEKEKLEK